MEITTDQLISLAKKTVVLLANQDQHFQLAKSPHKEYSFKDEKSLDFCQLHALSFVFFPHLDVS